MSNSSEQAHAPAKETASKILAGKQPCPPFEELKTLVKGLKGSHEFGPARRLISLARQSAPDNVWLTQQLALCTYKDDELLPSQRFADALVILESIGLREPDKVDHAKVRAETLPETLALGGAVYKRMFDHSGQLENLHSALALYRAAWERDPALDKGYGGVNAAYVLDLLASRLAVVGNRTGTKLDQAERLRQQARTLRQQMGIEVPKAASKETGVESQYWYAATLAEIDFGLANFTEAAKWLAKAKELEADEWQRQTTFRQLVSLARLQGYAPPAEEARPADWAEPWQALARFFDEGADRAFSCWRGKVGLALSGGGFRASFFHLGVLARLAEMDVLRSVEVLSTVSGGSIVGADYYLEMRNHLNTHEDRQITREDYVEIVRRVQKRFLRGVQQNLRTRALSNLGCNLKMLFPRLFRTQAYTRSHRMGELYEERLYSAVGDDHPDHQPRTMRSLLIKPAGEAASFKPKFSNWRRRAKVPVLLLNTTSLNSGHNWHFTASWMGEPPGLVGEEVDTNTRYRRLYYGQAPTEELRNYRLGYAVAASACVPALFDPLVIRGLYPGRTVRLVDGGVHDNQGVQGLLDESCTFILCSDASGQMDDNPSPSDGLLGVPLRSNSILMDRVREAEYQDLQARAQNHALEGLFFIHLKQDLAPASLDWVDCQDPGAEPPRLNTTSYGVDRDLQRKLAAIRTDLDSFSEVEAYALMLSGYLMTEREFKRLDAEYRREGGAGTWGGFDVNGSRQSWPFLALEGIAGKPPDSSDIRRQDLGKQLDVAASRTFKVWKLSSGLRAAGLGLLLLAVAAAGWSVYQNWDKQIGPMYFGGLLVAAGLLLAGLIFPAVKLINPQKAMRGWLVKLGLGLVGWVAANVHVHVFDPIFLKRGSLERLLKLPLD